MCVVNIKICWQIVLGNKLEFFASYIAGLGTLWLINYGVFNFLDILSVVGLHYTSELKNYMEIHQKAFAAAASPQTPLGELAAP